MEALEGLGRTNGYARKVRSFSPGSEARNDSWYAPQGDETAFEDSIEACRAGLAKAEVALQGFLHAN